MAVAAFPGLLAAAGLHESTVDERSQSDRLPPVRPGLTAVFRRPLLVEPDKKFPTAIALDAAFPRENVAATNNAPHLDSSLERSMQGEQGVGIAIGAHQARTSAAERPSRAHAPYSQEGNNPATGRQ